MIGTCVVLPAEGWAGWCVAKGAVGPSVDLVGGVSVVAIGMDRRRLVGPVVGSEL